MTREVAAALIGSLLVACASAPVPVTRSPQNPAHPAAREAVMPPAEPSLMSEAEPAAAQQSPESQGGMHQGHAMPAPPPTPAAAPAAGEYTCPMHPQVTADKPGSCSICGMTLVKKEKRRPQGGGRR